MRDYFSMFGLFAFFGFVAGLVLGGIVAFSVSDEVTRSLNSRSDLESACIEGNANACRVYEVRYGR